MVPLMTPFETMAQIEKILEMMRREPGNVSFNDFKKVCVSYFGKPRQDGSSHAVFKTPWTVSRIAVMDPLCDRRIGAT